MEINKLSFAKCRSGLRHDFDEIHGKWMVTWSRKNDNIVQTQSILGRQSNPPWIPGSRLTGLRPVSRKPRKLFGHKKDIAKSRTLRIQSCFIHTFLTWAEVPFIQEVSDVYASPFLDTNELKMALPAQKDSRGFRETGPWPCCHVIAKWAVALVPGIRSTTVMLICLPVLWSANFRQVTNGVNSAT